MQIASGAGARFVRPRNATLPANKPRCQLDGGQPVASRCVHSIAPEFAPAAGPVCATAAACRAPDGLARQPAGWRQVKRIAGASGAPAGPKAALVAPLSPAPKSINFAAVCVGSGPPIWLAFLVGRQKSWPQISRRARILALAAHVWRSQLASRRQVRLRSGREHLRLGTPARDRDDDRRAVAKSICGQLARDLASADAPILISRGRAPIRRLLAAN